MLLHVDDVGPGPVVVLLHGFPFDNTMWESQQATVGSEYRILSPDLRGHGRSVAPDEPVYPVDALADDVLETLDAMGIEGPVVLGGQSMGGYVALSIADRFPTRLRALMLFDTRSGADTPEAARVREDLAREVEAAGTAEPVVRSMIPKLFSPTTRQRRADLISRIGDRMLATPARAVAATLRGLATRPDRTGCLSRILVPTLVVCGVDDAITPLEQSRGLASAIPNARLVEIPDAGHLAPLENPAPVNLAILEFLRDLA
jgi:pimeloyl-ACP methyl ester carboxylesterase